MKHIIMLLSNAFRPDPRVEREAQALLNAGYRVTIICWDRRAELPQRETQNGLEIIRIHNVQSAYGSGWRQIFYLPRFWRQAIQQVLALRPDIIHCHDFDTLYAGWQVKKKLGCPLVYDAHEHYPALMSLYLPAPFIFGLEKWERRLMRRVDATITASTVLRDEFLQYQHPPVITLGNYQDLKPYTAVKDGDVQKLRSELGVSSNELLVAYIGGFSRNRMLVPFIEAAALLPGVQFHLWGDGLQRVAIEKSAAKYPNAHYHGWLPAHSLPVHFKAADIIYYCLRLDYPGAIYNAPNTLSQAMAAGRPIIANDVGDLGRIVRAADVGILLDQATPKAIARAIEKLRAPATRAQLAQNGLQSAQNTYNASAVQNQLIKLYQMFGCLP